jgi:hypothetical protein
MTSPRTLIVSIDAMAIAFAIALGSIVSSAAQDPSAGNYRAAKPSRAALAVAPVAHPHPAR